LLGLALALAIEGLTCLLRFGLGLQSTRETGWLAPFTCGYRIHHGYIGLVMLLVSPAVRAPSWRKALMVIGLGLAVSDAIHHFAILWPLTGSPEFHIRYPTPEG
jgi:hypothetical protein